ncbi:MAG: amino acid transporter [Devosia sp.]
MGKLVDNEKAKLSATFLNGVAIALLAVGVLAPAASFAAGTPATPGVLVILAVGCILLSAGLHYLGRQVLSGLKE